MGIETIIFAGLTAFQTLSTLSQGRKEAKQQIRQGELAASEKAKETRLRVGRAKASFLSSGLEMEGTPEIALSSMFTSGIADVNQILSNANTAAKNTVSQARTQAISNLAGSFAGSSMFSSVRSAGMFNPITENLPMGSFGGGYGYYGSSGTRIDWMK